MIGPNKERKPQKKTNQKIKYYGPCLFDPLGVLVKHFQRLRHVFDLFGNLSLSKSLQIKA